MPLLKAERNMRATSAIAADLEAGIDLYDDTLSHAWRDMLMRYQFQWFCTFTFAESVHPEAAAKTFEHWIKLLNQYLAGRKGSKDPAKQIFWVRALEWQKRDVIHYHALLAGNPESLHKQIRWSPDKESKSSIIYWEELWFHLAGICRIEEIRSHDAVAAYCSKYISKGGQIDMSNSIKHYFPE